MARDFLKLGDEPYMQFDNFKLRCYYPKEIARLSVLKITQVKTFDQVGEPVRGGLYDPVLGSGERRDRCETCNQYEIDCPGHVGHIELDLPVFNPVMFNFTFNLMKGSCVHCHRLTCQTTTNIPQLFLAQLRCIELGAAHLVPAVEEFFKTRFEDATLDGGHLKLLEEVDSFISSMMNKRISELTHEPPTKSGVFLRKQLVKEFCRQKLFKRLTRCPLCKKANGSLLNDQGRCLILSFSKQKRKGGKSASIYRSDEFEIEEDQDEDEKDEKETSLADENTGYGDGHDVSKSSLAEQLRQVAQGVCDKLAWRASEVREHFRELWNLEGNFLEKIFPMFSGDLGGNLCPLDGLFCEMLLVPPLKFRPIRMLKGDKYEDPQTMNLRRVLEANEVIKCVELVMRGEAGRDGRSEAQIRDIINSKLTGKTITAKMHNAYIALQHHVNCIYDMDLDKSADEKKKIPGIKQLLEKKQGLFRMNMMGKRVNYACRSVITPDPYLDVDEIGIPDIFAKKLTFTEPVNGMNEVKLRKLMENGPDHYPGANIYIDKFKKNVRLTDKSHEGYRLRRTLASQLSIHNELREPVKVLRHLQKGDMMIMNRQPSLHKPSIMGHRARILTGQKALRMNYAPCKAYNADFDGDEMNGHLVQTYIAQTEVSEIASVGRNLLVPKDATPLLGLIQDHVVSGVLLTIRGRFLNKEDFMHLVLASFAETSKRIEIPQPAMIKPQKLWTGKQVISAIIKNCIPKDKPAINLTGKAKTPLSCWKVRGYKEPPFDMSESEVVFRQGEMLVGVLDKAHCGATQYGLIHSCFELYGPNVGVKVISCFSRLFTTYLQFHGFTLGVADILVRPQADKKRKDAVKASRLIGDDVVRSTFSLDPNCPPEEIKHVLASAYNNPRGQGTDVKMLDFGMKQGLAKYNDAITKACMPEGLVRSFPENALQVMIQSGAKGSSVNAIQISCALGQIELEGKRMALTVAGRTLPSFRSFDSSPRAGGYIDQRFLTGINPQELFFHTMAGREGLIDTAVKTSRSGYLQRCIIKHLEGIKVHYDSTVRDHDGSIIQFRYGEDGMDTCLASYMNPKTYPFLEDNLKTVKLCSRPATASPEEDDFSQVLHHYKKIKKWKTSNDPSTKAYSSGFIEFSKEHSGERKSKVEKKWFELSDKERRHYAKMAVPKCPTAVNEKYNVYRYLGSLPEKTLDSVDKFIGKDEHGLKDNLRKVLYWKGRNSMAHPGENVGLLAAQSIGEPSTQMTLNTFHFAGRGEMNVTLGIPRLREILMTASKNISTPNAQIAIVEGTPRERIDKIKQDLDRVYLKQVVKKFDLEERMTLTTNEACRRYRLRIELLSQSKREAGAKHLKRSKIMQEIEHRLLRHICKAIEGKMKAITEYQVMQSKKLKSGNLAIGLGQDSAGPGQISTYDGGSSDEEADGGREADASEKRLHSRHNDEATEYEGEDEDRGAIGDSQESEQTEVIESDDEEEGEAGKSKEHETGDGTTDPSKPKKISPTERIQSVIRMTQMIDNYVYDVKSDSWCEVSLTLPLNSKTKLDLLTIIQNEIEKFVVHQTPGIERCVETSQQVNGREVTYIQTQGINLQAFFKHADVLDVNTIYSNDLNLILNNYGVEACAKAIVTEMNNVFGVYGIEVSKRHLTLTADYMTFTGEIMPFNRGAMDASSSPLQKMTFETTMNFLKEALIHGEEDRLNSPSSRLVVGSLNRGGTGAFDLFNDIYLADDMVKEMQQKDAYRINSF